MTNNTCESQRQIIEVQRITKKRQECYGWCKEEETSQNN